MEHKLTTLSGIPQEIINRVNGRLRTAANENDVEILHAIESGSRAWGFPSPDSDMDVRFIYVHRRDWYFSVLERRDVIESPIERVAGIDFDVNGWDLRKALRLLAKSNPVLVEWLQSPIVYATNTVNHNSFAEEMLHLAKANFSEKAAHYHYFHMAHKNYREHLNQEEILLKKYFYVLRPVLACLWVEKGLGIPPMTLTDLMDGLSLPGGLSGDILELRAKKMMTPEFGSGPQIPSIHAFLVEQLKRLESVAERQNILINDPSLDRFLRRWSLS